MNFRDQYPAALNAAPGWQKRYKECQRRKADSLDSFSPWPRRHANVRRGLATGRSPAAVLPDNRGSRASPVAWAGRSGTQEVRTGPFTSRLPQNRGQPVEVQQLGGVFIDRLDTVFPSDGGALVFIRSVRWDQLIELLNECVKAAWDEDRQRPARRLSGVAKGVRNISRKNGHRPRLRRECSSAALNLIRSL